MFRNDRYRPENMVEAMVKDTSSHLSALETARTGLESKIAEGKDEDEIRVATQSLVKVVKDYKTAAGHVKKASAKPKPKASKAKQPDPVGSA